MKRIDITCVPTFEDYLRAQSIHGRRRSQTVCVALLGLGLLLGVTRNEWWVFPLIIVYTLVARPWIFRMRVRTAWLGAPETNRAERTMGFDDEGVHARDTEDNPTLTPWSQFLKVRETTHLFLLYYNPRLYAFLPKRVMDDDQEDTLRQLFQERVGTTSKQ
ncbi:MAG: YcxB family protein [Lentisphaeria bacterium]|nr:YcxB family protein [Lentisphaeria bacterium]